MGKHAVSLTADSYWRDTAKSLTRRCSGNHLESSSAKGLVVDRNAILPQLAHKFQKLKARQLPNPRPVFPHPAHPTIDTLLTALLPV